MNVDLLLFYFLDDQSNFHYYWCVGQDDILTFREPISLMFHVNTTAASMTLKPKQKQTHICAELMWNECGTLLLLNMLYTKKAWFWNILIV